MSLFCPLFFLNGAPIKKLAAMLRRDFKKQDIPPFHYSFNIEEKMAEVEVILKHLAVSKSDDAEKDEELKDLESGIVAHQ